jgi:insertion element IS1 protein InsB
MKTLTKGTTQDLKIFGSVPNPNGGMAC